MKTLHINNGLSIEFAGQPNLQITEDKPVRRVAWQPPQNTSLNPESLVEISQHVSTGESLFIDKYAPQIRHVAPASGRVSEITRNNSNQLTYIVIETDNTPPKHFAIETPYNRTNIRQLLMASGLWTQLRQRPFDTVPPDNAEPHTILVSAIDTRPSAPNPSVVIQRRQAEFDAGLNALATQTDGTLTVCQAQGNVLTSNDKIETVCFTGVHPAGMPSLHMQKLCLVNMTRPLWHINYQDVIAIGHLLLHGEPTTETIVSLSGNQINRPRLVSTNRGANISELIEHELDDANTASHTIVGSILSGHTKQWLGQFDHQVTVMKNAGLKSLKTITSEPLISGFVADPVFDQVNALDILPVPLLRALVSDDVELAEKLGCQDICPEDLDIFSYVCPAGNRYSDLLANCLHQLRARYSNSEGNKVDAV